MKKKKKQKLSQKKPIGYYITTYLDTNKIEVMPMEGNILTFYNKEQVETFIRILKSHIHKHRP